MTSPAREAALEALAAARRRHAYVAPLAEQAARRRGLDPADHAMCVLLAKGVTRTVGTLDEAIGRYTKVERIEPAVLDVLRLAAFELLFLKTSPHAAVNEAVEAAKRRRVQAAKLVNAVLRRLAEEAPQFPWGDPATERDALSRLHGVPRWLLDAFVQDLGQDPTLEALSSLSVEPPLFARVNRLVADRDELFAELAASGIAVQQAPPDDLSFCVPEPAAFVHSDALAAERAFVCDSAAQFVALQAARPSVSTVLEVGAGRGTKTLVYLGAFHALGVHPRTVAVEPAAWRARIWAERLERAGIHEAEPIVADVRTLAESAVLQAADVVLLDAPCTGTGTLRRHPEAVWRLTPEDPGRLHQLQLDMLSAVAACVPADGLLVYSTCSVLRAENEQVVAAFLDSRAGAGFRVEALDPAPPAEWKRFVTPEGFFRSWPTVDGPDGHFVACLRRTA
ncbi:MAG: RsmB/NOP family class I SAM-dependent RNA methyltransferase [Anaerosomatales bacterium]|nr:RsmB/NOP family class I SAM-dependent RNA methyltransferase [Anaerosomatales bacterium]